MGRTYARPVLAAGLMAVGLIISNAAVAAAPGAAAVAAQSHISTGAVPYLQVQSGGSGGLSGSTPGSPGTGTGGGSTPTMGDHLLHGAGVANPGPGAPAPGAPASSGSQPAAPHGMPAPTTSNQGHGQAPSGGTTRKP